MNPRLSQLQPYPFEKLRRLMADISPAAGLKEIRLSIGEPQHATPAFIKTALSEGLPGLANYPSTAGMSALLAGTQPVFLNTLPDTEFTRELLRQYNVSVLSGSYLAHESDGINPAENYIRIALVAPPQSALKAHSGSPSFAASSN